MNHNFTKQLQDWMNTPDEQKDWAQGALLLLQLSGNRIMYHNISVNPKGKAEFIKGKLQQYLNFRLRDLTKTQVQEMQQQVDEIVKKVIKPNFKVADSDAGRSGEATANSQSEFADFKAGKRADHDMLPDEIKALYAENLQLLHRMREVHLRLRSLSLENATCPDSERYPFLKEIIALDKRLRSNWDIYDHFVIGVTPVPASNTTASSVGDNAIVKDATAASSVGGNAIVKDATAADGSPVISSGESQEQTAPTEQAAKKASKAKATKAKSTRKSSKSKKD